MPSIRYINQSAPFWDFIANFENETSFNPFVNHHGAEHREGPPAFGPWGWGWGPYHGRHRGAHHPQHRNAAPNSTAEAAQNQAEKAESSSNQNPEKASEKAPQQDNAGDAQPGDENPLPHRRGCGARRAGHCGGAEFRRGRCGGRTFVPGAGPFGFGAHLADFLKSQLNEDGQDKDGAAASEDFKPEADVFDTETSFVIHVSLPGANKEDVGVNWDAEKSELSIAGVNYRPGDEEFLKTLALNERRAGAFEKKIRLGTRANPAQVDVDGITARLEDGILKVEVPKLDQDYVEIKKVDIE